MKVGEIFIYRGVTFEVVRNGKNALMLYAKSDFLTCECIEVWMKRESKDRTINGKLVKGGLRKPSNNDYPYTAHQFLSDHFKDGETFRLTAMQRFNEYENGIRPKTIKR